MGVRFFHSNFGESRAPRQRRCDQSEFRIVHKLCKSPSGDGSDDWDTLKNYLSRSSRCDSGEPQRRGSARPGSVRAPHRAVPGLAAQPRPVHLSSPPAAGQLTRQSGEGNLPVVSWRLETPLSGGVVLLFFLFFFKSCFRGGGVAGEDETLHSSALFLERLLLLGRGKLRAPWCRGTAGR